MKYDFVVVGAGISSAAFCSRLKDKKKICVIDIRPHIGGNCYDYEVNNTYVQVYGPHFFHTKNQIISDYLSKFTEWIEYKHSVEAEIDYEGLRMRVPFPYSKQTELAIGDKLTQEQRIDIFFKPYSKKMWGQDWETLPDDIKNRIPKDTKDTSNYFPNQFCALPKNGYTKMMEKMFDGVDMILNADPNEWKKIQADKIIYCGRPDHILADSKILEWRNLKFTRKVQEWDSPATVVNFCHSGSKFTRKVGQGKMWNTDNKLVIYEEPCECEFDNHNPFYPIPTRKNTARFNEINDEINNRYPNLHLLGRVANYRYIDMDVAVEQGMSLAEIFR